MRLSVRLVGGLIAHRREEIVRQHDGHPPLREIQHRHERLGERQERGGATRGGAEFEEVAAAVIRNRDDRADDGPGLVNRGGAD